MAVSFRRGFINLAVGLVAAALTLGVLEVAFRLFVPQQYASPLVHVWDKETALRQLAGATGRIVTPEFAVDVKINSKGLRDSERPYSKPPGTRRLLCLGDSFTFGYGVREEEAYPRQLERLLNAGAQAASRWEVINAGVPGTGTAHQLAYFNAEGHKYEPDCVLLVFCGSNDFRDNIMCGLYSVEGGKLAKHDAQISRVGKVRRAVEGLPGYRSIFRRSQMLLFVGHRLALWAHKRSAIPPGETAKIAARNAAAYDLTEAIVLGLEDACRVRGAALVVAAAPQLGVGKEAEEIARLTALLEARGIATVDLAPRFVEAAARGETCFYPLDHHWTALGHTLVAETLCGYFLGANAPLADAGPR